MFADINFVNKSVSKNYICYSTTKNEYKPLNFVFDLNNSNFSHEDPPYLKSIETA